MTTKKISNAAFLDYLCGELDNGQSVLLTVRGWSMMPFISQGDQALLDPVAGHPVRRGDIVLAKHNNRYVLHRVVRILNGTIELAGDAVLSGKERVTPESIHGVVVAIGRGGQGDLLPIKFGVQEQVYTSVFLIRWIYLKFFYITSDEIKNK